jgi:hypothetical protein
MYEGNRAGIGWGNGIVAVHIAGSVTNVLTCEMADAPGIFVATTRASIWVIGCARAACHVESPSATAIPAAKAIIPGKLLINFDAAQYILIANLP